MAKFWNDLKRHEDNVEKHKITDEEIQFLKHIQHEMNTQDNVGQADPRYWVIRNYKRVYGKGLNSADGASIYDAETCENIIEIDYHFLHIDKMIESILKAFKDDDYEISEEEIENIKLSYDMDSLVKALEEMESIDLIVSEYQDIPEDDGMFFTHEAAIEHLKNNAHHYSDDAHTYAKTAWRSSEEKLWDILHSVDFDRLREG